MKKILMALMMTLMFWNVSEGQVVNSVAGIEFGTDKQTTIRQLISRFGYDYTDNGAYVTFEDVSIGGINYDWADFGFANSKLLFARIYSTYDLNSITEARQKLSVIINTYTNKYGTPYVADLDGDTFYCYGRTKWSTDTKYPIMISIEQVLSSSGKKVYGVYVYYYRHLYSNNDDI